MSARSNIMLKDEVFALNTSRTEQRYLKLMEREIEGGLINSKRRGWDYNEFVLHALEVLVILRHRSSID